MTNENKTKEEVSKKMEAILAKNKGPKKVTNNKARELGSFWVKNSKKFIKELEVPTCSQYKQIFRLYATGALVVGVFCYGIKVIHIPINNMFVGK